jgi:hypothetical protein
MRIRVTTRANLFQERKQQHIDRGYRIEDERPIPVNGLCSFVAVSETPASDSLGELVAQALDRNRLPRGDLLRYSMLLRIRIRLMANVRRIPIMTQYEMDGRNMGIVMDVTLSTSFIFMFRSEREGPQERGGLWLERPRGQKNNPESMGAHSFQMLTVGDCTCGEAE